jgi:hypothetical protein
VCFHRIKKFSLDFTSGKAISHIARHAKTVFANDSVPLTAARQSLAPYVDQQRLAQSWQAAATGDANQLDNQWLHHQLARWLQQYTP